MKQILAIIVAALIFCFTASAQTPFVFSLEECGADEVVVNYWNNATAPHSNGITEPESVSEGFKRELFNTSQTDFYVFKADPKIATGQGVVLVPGGGYRKLSIKFDGFKVAEYLRSIGVTTIVVKYRLPNGHREVPLEDAQAGLRYMRTEGKAWGVDPAQVGILGCSAGGHLAAHTSTFTPDAEKPAFTILVYPVISGMTRSPNHGTFGNLLGKERTNAEQEYYSLENRVSATTPPTLFLLADDDLRVSTVNSMLYYKRLRHFGIPAAIYTFPSGGHGWAGHDEYKYAEPCKAAIKDWLMNLEEYKNRTKN
ncbi:MAG: alpha/beta hydrolase [Alistipes sp.]|nr:alpha/beta hydrolase [Alistipes sp.]